MPRTSSTSSNQFIPDPASPDGTRRGNIQIRSAGVFTSAESDEDSPSVIEGRRKKKGKQKQRDGSKDRGPGGAEGIRSISQASLPSMCSIEIAEGGGAGSEADIIGPGENNQSAPGQHSKSTLVAKSVLPDGTRKGGIQTCSASICTSDSEMDSLSVIEKGRAEKGKQRQDRAPGGAGESRETSQASLPCVCKPTSLIPQADDFELREVELNLNGLDVYEANSGLPTGVLRKKTEPGSDTSRDDESPDTYWPDGLDYSYDQGQPRKFPLEPESLDPWAATYKRVEVLDNDTCSSWRDEIDKLLFFAGLFSAAVTAFAVEAYQWLDDPNDNTATRSLDRISQQLAHATGIPAVEAKPFKVPSWVIRVNILWFLSLILSLNSVLIGILCLQWVREFQRNVTHLTHKEALVIRQVRYMGLLGWKVPQIISMLPLLLQLAMILFFIGVVDFLFAKNQVVGFCALVPILLGIGFYFFTCLVPCIQLRFGMWRPWTVEGDCVEGNISSPNACPYKSPLALFLCRIIVPGNYDSWLAIDKYYRKGGCPSLSKNVRSTTEPATAALLIWLRENMFQEWASLVDIVACFRSCKAVELVTVFRLKFPSSKIRWEGLLDFPASGCEEWIEWLFLRWMPEHSSPDGLQAATELWARSSSVFGLRDRENYILPTAELNPILENAYNDKILTETDDENFAKTVLSKVFREEAVYYMLRGENMKIIINVLESLCKERPAGWIYNFTTTLDYIVHNTFSSPDIAFSLESRLSGSQMIPVISSCLHDGHFKIVAIFSRAYLDIVDIVNITHRNPPEGLLRGSIRWWMFSGKLRPWIDEDEQGQIVEQPSRLIGDKTKEAWIRSIEAEWEAKREAEKEMERRKLPWSARVINPIMEQFSRKVVKDGVVELGRKDTGSHINTPIQPTRHTQEENQKIPASDRSMLLYECGIEPPWQGDIGKGSVVGDRQEKITRIKSKRLLSTLRRLETP